MRKFTITGVPCSSLILRMKRATKIILGVEKKQKFVLITSYSIIASENDQILHIKKGFH
jgi:hypothetical protein